MSRLVRTGTGEKTRAGERLFWSDFEEPITWARTYSGNEAYDRPSSPNNAKGFSWPPTRFSDDTFIQHLSNYVTMDATEFAKYFERGIVTANTSTHPTAGHSGSSTKKMFHQVLKRPVGEIQYYDGNAGDQLQAPLIMTPAAAFRRDVVLYQRSWHYMPSNLFTTNLPNTEEPGGSGNYMNFRLVWEYKTGSLPNTAGLGDRRCVVQITNGDGRGTHWKLYGDQNANGGLPSAQLFMQQDVVLAPVPGAWYKLEVIVKHAIDGFIRAAINDTIIGTYAGSLIGQNNQGIDRYFASQIYFGGYYPSSQYMDEIDIWAYNAPSGSVLRLN